MTLERRQPPTFLKEFFAEDDRQREAFELWEADFNRRQRDHGVLAPEPEETPQLSEVNKCIEDALTRFCQRELNPMTTRMIDDLHADIADAIQDFLETIVDPEMKKTVAVLRREIERAARLPQIRGYDTTRRYLAGEICCFGGGTYQAIVDTNHRPGHRDWTCVAAPGTPGVDGRDHHAEIEALRKELNELKIDLKVKDTAEVLDLPDWKTRLHAR